MPEITTLQDALLVIQKQNKVIQGQCTVIAKLEQEQRTVIAKFEKRIQHLERRLQTNSSNSSKPPSSDCKGKSKDGQLRGGPKVGHQGFYRAAIRPEEVTERIVLTPDQCPRCNSKDLISERKPKYHRQFDLPQPAIVVREYRLEQCRCQNCGKHVKASLPPEVSGSVIAPDFAAKIAFWSYSLSLPIRKLGQLVHTLTGQRFCSATMLACQKRMSAALEQPHSQVLQESQQELWRGADETTWRTHGQRRYVWMATGNRSTAVLITGHRDRASSLALLGDVDLPLVTDRYVAYKSVTHHQYCLAHWKRNLKKLELYPKAAEIQCHLEIDLDWVFEIWRKYRSGELSSKQWYSRTHYRRRGIESTLHYYSRAGPDQEVRALCESWLKDSANFWTYLRVPGMEPTNNRTERELRPLVVRRKINGGTRSDQGERFVERMYSVIATLQKRGSDYLAFLTRALKAYFAGNAAPRLPA